MSSGQGEGTGGDRSDPSESKPSFFGGLKQRASFNRLRRKLSGTILDKNQPTESQDVPPPVPQLPPPAPVSTSTGGPSAVTDGKASIEPRAFLGGPIAPFKDLDPHERETQSHVQEPPSLSRWSDSTVRSPSSPEDASSPASPASVASFDTFGNPRADLNRPGSLSAAMATSAAPHSANTTSTWVSGSGQASDIRRYTFGQSPQNDKEGDHTQ